MSSLEKEDKIIKFEYEGHELSFFSDASLFSPGQVDRGTQAMLSEISFEKEWRILDLGCGYGVVGASAATVTGFKNVIMTDVNEKAVALSRKNILYNFYPDAFGKNKENLTEIRAAEDNAVEDKVTEIRAAESKAVEDIIVENTAIDNKLIDEIYSVLEKNIFVSDGLKNITEKDFDIILSNPPYHTDFSIAKEFIEDGYRKLKTGGRMVMVTKRRTWYENKLRSVFGGVRVIEKDGYVVFIAEKREKKPVKDKTNQAGMSKKLQRKMEQRNRKRVHSV